jgi:ferredoxin
MVSDEAPDLVQEGQRGDDGRQGRPAAGQRVPRRRHLAHRHHQVGEAQHRHRFPVWDPDVCIQCNKCAMVCPHAAIRAKVYDETDLAGSRVVQVMDYKAKEFKGKKFTIQVAPEDCTGCHLCVRSARRRTRPIRRRRPSTWKSRTPVRRTRTGQLRHLPRSARNRSHRDHPRRREGLAVPPAAVRILRRVRGLRRNAVRQTADATVRRPHAHRQRHRVLIDLRRQPADHAVHRRRQRARAGLGELAVRRQRRVRLRLPPGGGRPRRSARNCCPELARADR